MHFTLEDYRNIFYPKISLHQFEYLEILIELFEDILLKSEDGFFKPRLIQIHLEPWETEMTLIEFDAQKALLMKFVEHDLLYMSNRDTDWYVINPKIIKYLEGRDQLEGKNINPN